MKIWRQIRLILGGKLTPKFYRTQRTVLRQLIHIKQSQGTKGLVLYLKTCAVLTQQSVNGYRIDNVTDLGPRVSRTKAGGLPRIIPLRHRKIITRRLVGYTVWVRFYLTVFHTYRVLTFPGLVNLGSISDAGKFFDISKYELYIDTFLRLFVPSRMRFSSLDWMAKRFKFFSIVKSSPQTTLFTKTGFLADRVRAGLWSTHPVALYHSILAIRNSELFIYFDEFMKAWAPRLGGLVGRVGDIHPITKDRISLPLGKLGFKEEAAGKVRVFAMVDPITQWLLYPLHRFLFAILRRIPMDGTFDQLRPVRRLLRLYRSVPLYSLDLSSATDRLPAVLQARLLDLLVSGIPLFGQKWKALLVNRTYVAKSPPFGLDTTVSYAVGQPMGALSSWAMLAFVHHFIIQVAAWEAGHSRFRLFTAYAVLGDDVVIASKSVARSYLRLLDEMGVKCGLAKSIISPGRGLEFAKRTFVDGVDVSPVPLLELEAALSSLTAWASFARKYGLSFDRQARVLGFGRARLRSFPRLNHALQAVRLSGVLKADFNTSVLRWAPSAVTRNFDELSKLFVDVVLRPLGASLTKLQTDYDLLNDSSFIRDLTQIASERRILKEVFWPVAFSESNRVYGMIQKLWDVRFTFSKIRTFDQAIKTYLQFLQVKAFDSVDVLCLRPKVIRRKPGMLPFQVKMYRLWARASLKFLASVRSRQTKG